MTDYVVFQKYDLWPYVVWHDLGHITPQWYEVPGAKGYRWNVEGIIAIHTKEGAREYIAQLKMLKALKRENDTNFRLLARTAVDSLAVS